MGYICICLDQPFQAMIKGLKTNPQKMMATLNINLTPKANTSKLMLLTQLINISQIVDINMELMNNNLVLPNFFILMVILNMLPAKYNTMRPVIEVQTKLNLTQ